MCEQYNGWSNVFTWKINLWGILDDEDMIQDMIRQAAAESMRFPYSVEENKQGARSHLADALKEYVEELFSDVYAVDMTGPAGDLLSSALGMVDWIELAQHAALDHDDLLTELCTPAPDEEEDDPDDNAN